MLSINGWSAPEAQSAALLAEKVQDGELVLKQWDHQVEQWILRLNWLAQTCPELELPEMDEEAERALLESICLGGFGYQDIKERPVMPHLKQWLNPTQREILEKHAPERVKLSNGKTPKLTYSREAPPIWPFVYRTLRCNSITDHRDAQSRRDGTYSGPQHASGANHSGHGRFLERPLSRHQARATATLSKTCLALKV